MCKSRSWFHKALTLLVKQETVVLTSSLLSNRKTGGKVESRVALGFTPSSGCHRRSGEVYALLNSSQHTYPDFISMPSQAEVSNTWRDLDYAC